jgi:hypothetical protein
MKRGSKHESAEAPEAFEPIEAPQSGSRILSRSLSCDEDLRLG